MTVGAPLRHPTGISVPPDRFSDYRRRGLLRKVFLANQPKLPPATGETEFPKSIRL